MVSSSKASYLASFPTAVRKLCQCTTSPWDSSGLPGCLATPRNGQCCPSEPRVLSTPVLGKRKTPLSPCWWERLQPVHKQLFTASSPRFTPQNEENQTNLIQRIKVKSLRGHVRVYFYVWVGFSREDGFPMDPEFDRAAKKAWFRTIQEVYCWGENPSLALQTEALQSWTSRKPAQPPVCSFSMACHIMKPDRVRGSGGGADTTVDQRWKSTWGFQIVCFFFWMVDFLVFKRNE